MQIIYINFISIISLIIILGPAAFNSSYVEAPDNTPIVKQPAFLPSRISTGVSPILIT